MTAWSPRSSSRSSTRALKMGRWLSGGGAPPPPPVKTGAGAGEVTRIVKVMESVSPRMRESESRTVSVSVKVPSLETVPERTREVLSKERPGTEPEIE